MVDEKFNLFSLLVLVSFYAFGQTEQSEANKQAAKKMKRLAGMYNDFRDSFNPGSGKTLELKGDGSFKFTYLVYAKTGIIYERERDGDVCMTANPNYPDDMFHPYTTRGKWRLDGKQLIFNSINDSTSTPTCILFKDEKWQKKSSKLIDTTPTSKKDTDTKYYKKSSRYEVDLPKWLNNVGGNLGY